VDLCQFMVNNIIVMVKLHRFTASSLNPEPGVPEDLEDAMYRGNENLKMKSSEVSRSRFDPDRSGPSKPLSPILSPCQNRSPTQVSKSS
jgi:hypothetical protein